MTEKEYFTLPTATPSGVFYKRITRPDGSVEERKYTDMECSFFNSFLRNVMNMNREELYSYIDRTLAVVGKINFNNNQNFSYIFDHDQDIDKVIYMSYIKDIILENIEDIPFKEPLTAVQCAKLRLKHA